MAKKKITPKTAAEVETELALLKDMAPRIRQTNAFGDSNREKIEAQIEVLEEDMDTDEIYGRFEDDEHPDSSSDLVGCAQDARRWMDGEEGDSPSDGWKDLIVK